LDHTLKDMGEREVGEVDITFYLMEGGRGGRLVVVVVVVILVVVVSSR